MKVLVLATSYPLHADDNSPVFLKHLYEHLTSADVDVHIIVPADQSGGYVFENGIHVHRFRYMFRPLQKLCYGSGVLPNLKHRPWLWLIVPYFVTAFLIASLKVGFKVGPSVIHGHWFLPTGLIGIIVSRLLRVPFVITAHGGDAYSLKSGFLKKLKKYIARNADAWTANTETTARQIDAAPEESNFHIIPMGVDTELFQKRVIATRTEQDKYKILFVGRLVEKKGVDVLLRALTLLPSEFRNQIQLDIVGGGQEQGTLKELATELGINKITNFVGPVSNYKLPEYLSAADLFVGPSIVDAGGDTEGQGVVFIEAMACQLCVLASDVGGIADVIQNEVNGVLVPPENPEKLSSAIHELLLDDDRRKRLASSGYQLVSEKYNWMKIAEEFKSLYLKLK